jgi:hypothetical protein
MNKKIENKLVLLESTRLDLLEKLKGIDEQKLNASPEPGKWSVAQVIYHLNQAETNSVIYVSKKMLDVDNLKKSGLYEKIKMALVKLAFILPIRYKAPAVLGEMPANVSYVDMTAKWNETRKRLKELIASMPEDMLSKKVFKQPAAGRLDIYQMLDFMQTHFNRHLKQVERIMLIND